jgi:hypothetical protein
MVRGRSYDGHRTNGPRLYAAERTPLTKRSMLLLVALVLGAGIIGSTADASVPQASVETRSCTATHRESACGRGGVSAKTVGAARASRPDLEFDPVPVSATEIAYVRTLREPNVEEFARGSRTSGTKFPRERMLKDPLPSGYKGPMS